VKHHVEKEAVRLGSMTRKQKEEGRGQGQNIAPKNTPLVNYFVQ
jgi:hypothetical protein